MSILVNFSAEGKKISFESDVLIAVTDKENDLKEYRVAAKEEIEIRAESVTTVVMEG